MAEGPRARDLGPGANRPRNRASRDQGSRSRGAEDQENQKPHKNVN